MSAGRKSRIALIGALTTTTFALAGLAPATAGRRPPQAHAPDPRVDVLAYRFELELTDDSDRIRGVAGIRARLLTAGVAAVTLDLVQARHDATGMTVDEVLVDGAPTGFDHADDRLRVTVPDGAAREVVLRVTYGGVPADGLVISRNRHGERTFFGDNWPDRARHWLPVVDHVADKARVAFVVTAPDHYQVVSNGRLIEETDLEAAGLRRTHWASAVDLPPKVMVIGVARFAVQHLGAVDGVPLQSWVYPQDRDAGFHDYAVARRVLAFFIDRIGSFPYAKLANVQSKTRFGGMENAGSIFYSERSVTGTRRSEGLIAHEIAHQWFGDSVSEADWPHVWLSEGFATYFAQLYAEATYGRERLQAAMTASRSRVIAYAQSAPEKAVLQPEVENLMELLNANSYQKGGWVLHMLRREIGDAAFWAGTRAYYARFRDRNATSDELRTVMESACGCELSGFFQQWLTRPGQPTLEHSWDWDVEDSVLRIRVRQVQPGAPFVFPLDLGIATADGLRVEQVRVTDRDTTVDFALEGRPADVTLDPDIWLLFRDPNRDG